MDKQLMDGELIANLVEIFTLLMIFCGIPFLSAIISIISAKKNQVKLSLSLMYVSFVTLVISIFFMMFIREVVFRLGFLYQSALAVFVILAFLYILLIIFLNLAALIMSLKRLK